MSLKLMYITNRPDVALIAERAGVDRIFIDMEYVGKDERQAGLDTVKSHHTIDDIKKIRKVIKSAELLVRINPISDRTIDFVGSETEINDAIEAGADILMLPMFKTVEEVAHFIKYVNGRVKTMLLVETPEAAALINEIVKIPGIDEIHIGLNDMHLALKKKFMFELLAEGTVDEICKVIAKAGIPYGFGGIARIGYGMLPAEYVVKEHYRLKSSFAILSRAFCNVDKISQIEDIAKLFEEELVRIRYAEQMAMNMSDEELSNNHVDVINLVKRIVEQL